MTFLSKLQKRADYLATPTTQITTPDTPAPPPNIKIDFARTVPNPRSPELRREIGHLEKNQLTLLITSPELKSEIPANTWAKLPTKLRGE